MTRNITLILQSVAIAWAVSIPMSALASEHVILLHGLGRTDRAMSQMAKRLEREGYVIHNLDYPSRSSAPDELVDRLVLAIDACAVHDSDQIHLVGHSLGAILIRAALAETKPDALGRIVQIAPPNHGSEVVDRLQDNGLFRRAFGPTAIRLGTDPESLPNQLPAPDYDLGIIAARYSTNLFGSLVIPGPDDGSVSLESARLADARDFLVVPGTHWSIRNSRRVATQVAHFLTFGHFDHRRARRAGRAAPEAAR